MKFSSSIEIGTISHHGGKVSGSDASFCFYTGHSTRPTKYGTQNANNSITTDSTSVMLTRTGHARTRTKPTRTRTRTRLARTRTRTSLTVTYCKLQLNLQSLQATTMNTK